MKSKKLTKKVFTYIGFSLAIVFLFVMGAAACASMLLFYFKGMDSLFNNDIISMAFAMFFMIISGGLIGVSWICMPKLNEKRKEFLNKLDGKRIKM